ncbi:hypothetical protein [Palleronia sp.]|uniref:hypothetical protein n=1 Tax=Palleronia sp. TaxID=1940284 RepID=UPI0035C81BF9
MSAGVEIERRHSNGGTRSFLVWLISPTGHRMLFHEADAYAEALEFALEAAPVFGPVLRDDGAEPIQ